jgi:hypothetical protein
MKTLIFHFGFCCLVLTGLPTFAQPSADAPTYKQSGFSATLRLGRDLYNALKPQYRDKVHVQPVSLETDVMPFVHTVEYPDEVKPMRMVFISAGFFDLINNVAHAKAIDKIQKGYFEKYVTSLAQETGEKSLKDLPNVSDKRFWTEDMMNEQLSNFNQMTGMLLAIELSHHYLGHFKKYEAKLNDPSGKAVPINSFLTEKEWDESLEAGIDNALDCGFGIDGVKALYESIDKMPKRPAWAVYFLPENSKYAKIKKVLEKKEKVFFGK